MECTLRDAVSFVLDCYGGSLIGKSLNISWITQCLILVITLWISAVSWSKTYLLTRMCMLNTATIFKSKSQFEPEEIIRDRPVASNRIHIERVIGLRKTF